MAGGDTCPCIGRPHHFSTTRNRSIYQNHNDRWYSCRDPQCVHKDTGPRVKCTTCNLDLQAKRDHREYYVKADDTVLDPPTPKQSTSTLPPVDLQTPRAQPPIIPESEDEKSSPNKDNEDDDDGDALLPDHTERVEFSEIADVMATATIAYEELESRTKYSEPCPCIDANHNQLIIGTNLISFHFMHGTTITRACKEQPCRHAEKAKGTCQRCGIKEPGDKGKEPEEPEEPSAGGPSSGGGDGGGGGGGPGGGRGARRDRDRDDDDDDLDCERDGRDGLVNKPDTFDGNPKDWEAWWKQIRLNIFANYHKKLRSDRAKIVFVLSYMQGGTAGDWAEAFLESVDFMTADWESFQQRVIKQFSRDRHSDSLQKLRELKQGNMSVREFRTRFEMYAARAGYGALDEQLNAQSVILIDYLDEALQRRVLDAVWNREVVPTRYTDYMRIAENIDENQRKHYQRQKNLGSSQPHKPAPKPQTQSQAPAASSQTQAPRRDYRDGTGTTFGGAGQPMNLDRARKEGLCFNCHQKGHLLRDCPMPKQPRQVRGVSTDLPDEKDDKPKPSSAQADSLPDGMDERIARVVESSFMKLVKGFQAAQAKAQT